MSIEVSTGSRLHFGMFSFGHPGTRQFGGVGAMIDAPGVRIRVSPAPRLEAQGPLAERALQTARHVFRCWGETVELGCAIEVIETPRQHVGLGTGTQLALAVARGLHAHFDRACTSAAALARCSGRGLRSAVGLHGFWHGGLLLEGGKLRNEDVSPLVSRVELPPAWRFVLVCPREESGLCGADEQAAFDRLPPVPDELTGQLCREAIVNLLPAAIEEDFGEFSRSLFRFGQMAGRCFASQQSGIYATAQCHQIVELIRRQGIEGVGQSSWGPTLFALMESEGEAKSLVNDLHALREVEIFVARALNSGATVSDAKDRLTIDSAADDDG